MIIKNIILGMLILIVAGYIFLDIDRYLYKKKLDLLERKGLLQEYLKDKLKM